MVHSSGSALKQKTFPDRRSHVKNRRSLPAKIERQSTLTQRWSFDGESSQLQDDEDEIEDFEDEEYGLHETKKKRRKTLPSGKNKNKGVGKGQNTMTQMGYVSFSSNVEDQNDLEDEDRVMITASDEDEDERVPESVTSQDDTAIAMANGGRIESEELGNDVGNAVVRPRKGPSPEFELSLGHLTTPKKTFPDEIPSSNTPQSAIMWLIRSRATTRSPSKSPLRNRSMNVLDSPLRALRPIQETPAKEAVSFSPWSITKTPIFRVPALPARRVSVAKTTPTLERRSTIPDSDDMLVEETQQFKSSPKVVSARRLKRIPSTIQDTQFDSLGLEVTDDMETDDEQDDDEQANYGYGGTMDCTYPYYDTVASALDRDAARYMQTQRLKDAQRAMRPDVVPDTQEGSAEDLLAGRRQLPGNFVDFASFQNIGHTLERQQSQSRELGQMDDDTSTHSQSLPATPAKPERSHHRQRFHDIPVVDLTADSLEPVIPTTSGTPTPKTGSQAPIDIHCRVSSPSNKDNRNISSSPPLPSRGDKEDAGDTVEFLQLNDVEPRPAAMKRKKQHETHVSSQSLPQPGNLGYLDAGDFIPPSQVSTVGNLTQVYRSGLGRTQIKQEQEDLYSATPRVPRDLHQNVSLDPEDEDIDIYETVLTNGDLNAGRIEHVNLSDQPDPDDLEDDYVEIDRIEERVSYSSPLPPAPGHTLAEYRDDDNEEISSDFPHITSPPRGSSLHGDRASSSSHTSPATHAHVPDLRTEERELTPRALTGKAVPNVHHVADTGASPTKQGSGHARQPLSVPTRGDQPLYTIPSSQPDEDEDSLSNRYVENHCGNSLTVCDTNNVEQHSWQFRPANEILPDTQFSLIFPPIPSSDDNTQQRGELEQAQKQKLHDWTEDVSLAPPPKSSYEWMNKGLRKT